MTVPAPEREYHLSLPCGDIAVCEWGSEQLTPLFMLHGWLDNAGSFFDLAPRLSSHYRCIAIDLPGHGASSHLGASATYHFVDGVFVLHSVLEALQFKRVALLGHSMGGALALLYAGSFVDRISHLVSIEAFGPLWREAGESAQQLMQACQEKLAHHESRKTIYPSFERALAVRAAAGDVAGHLLEPIVRRNLHRVDEGYQWRSDGRLRLPSMQRMTPEQISAFVSAIRAPTLVLRATNGLKFVAQSLQQHMHELARGRELEIPGGHHVHLEQPEVVAQAILAFLVESNVLVS